MPQILGCTSASEFGIIKNPETVLYCLPLCFHHTNASRVSQVRGAPVLMAFIKLEYDGMVKFCLHTTTLQHSFPFQYFLCRQMNKLCLCEGIPELEIKNLIQACFHLADEVFLGYEGLTGGSDEDE